MFTYTTQELNRDLKSDIGVGYNDYKKTLNNVILEESSDILTPVDSDSLYDMVCNDLEKILFESYEESVAFLTNGYLHNDPLFMDTMDRIEGAYNEGNLFLDSNDSLVIPLQ